MSEVETRLDRLEAIAESTLLAIRALSTQSTQQQAQQETTLLAIRELSAQQQAQQALIVAESQNVVGMITSLAEDMQTFRQNMAEMQSEVRGLQTENRRILDRLERHTSDGHSDSA